MLWWSDNDGSKKKELATQCTLWRDSTPSYKADSHDLKEPEHQEVLETLANDTTKHLSETQTKGTIEPAENGRDHIGDPTRDFAIDSVGSHRENLTGGMQLQPQQNRGLTRGANLQLQQNVDAMEVDPPKIPNPCIVEVVADQITANKADDLSDSVSDSEIKTHVTVLRKQKKRAELKVELEHLKRKKAGGFVSERNQMGSNKHACQLSLKHLKCVWDPNVYLALS